MLIVAPAFVVSENGCAGVVALGSLGEGATLSFDEKKSILHTLGKAVNGGGTLVASISSLTTSESVSLAKAASDLGCSGLMVLPPYVYLGDWREMKAHVAAVFRATPLSCMLYNNPVAYGTDFLPEHIQELASEFDNFRAVKESSTDARRVSAIRALVDDRIEISVGVDDAVLEAIEAGDPETGITISTSVVPNGAPRARRPAKRTPPTSPSVRTGTAMP